MLEKFCLVLKNCSGPQVVTPVVWNKPDVKNPVPLWIIILAILAGLLLLALLIYVLYKVSDVTLQMSRSESSRWINIGLQRLADVQKFCRRVV